MFLLICAFAVVWFLCGIFAYALAFAFFQREYELTATRYYRTDMYQSFIIGVCGLCGLVAVLLHTKGRHGLKFW